MNKNSTFYFFNTYDDEKISSEFLNSSGEKCNVGRNKNYQEIFSPSVKSVNAILNFAKSYDVLHTKATGCIEMNKN